MTVVLATDTLSLVISSLSLCVALSALALALRKERKRLTVRGRHYVIEPDPGMPYLERHVEVIAMNRRHRPITLVELGMRMTNGETEWKRIDGEARPSLPVTLGDGEIAVMSWVTDDTGEGHGLKETSITEVFARDADGKVVVGRMEKDAEASFYWDLPPEP